MFPFSHVPGRLAGHPDVDVHPVLGRLALAETREQTRPETRGQTLLCAYRVRRRPAARWPAYTDDEPYGHEMAAGYPRARYAWVDDASGHWDMRFRSVEYPWDDAAARADDFGGADVAK